MHSDRFFQHFVVDVFVCIELNNLNWVRINQQQLRVDLYSEIMNRLNEKIELIDIDKKIIILLFNHVDDLKYIKIRKQNALTLIRKYDKFIYFIIFTCNSNWKKFHRDLFKKIFIKDQSNLTTRVFQLKLKKLLRDFIERHVLDEVKIYTYVIKFQKKNLFHVHILIINHFLNEVTNDNIDVVVKIVISLMSKDYVTNSKFKKTRLYDLMTSHMIHKNCFKIKNVVCHDKNDICIKRFSKL